MYVVLCMCIIFIQVSDEEKTVDTFFNSSDIHTRTFSCLLIFHTVTQGM